MSCEHVAWTYRIVYRPHRLAPRPRRARPCVLLGRPPEAGANDTLHFRQELIGAIGIANCKYWCELVRNRASLWHLLAHAGPSKPTEPRVEGFSLLVSCGTNYSICATQQTSALGMDRARRRWHLSAEAFCCFGRLGLPVAGPFFTLRISFVPEGLGARGGARHC